MYITIERINAPQGIREVQDWDSLAAALIWKKTVKNHNPSHDLTIFHIEGSQMSVVKT